MMRYRLLVFTILLILIMIVSGCLRLNECLDNWTPDCKFDRHIKIYCCVNNYERYCWVERWRGLKTEMWFFRNRTHCEPAVRRCRPIRNTCM
jgi:hypothetical protein